MPDIFVDPKPSIAQKIPHANHFASFAEHPYGVSFQNQEPDEVILLFLRRHFVTNISWIFLAAVFLVIPLLFPFIPFIDVARTPLTSLPSNFLTVFLIFYYLLIFTFVLVQLMTWYFNISIVTHRRIIDIDFSDLIYHDVAVTKLELIEDVNYTQIGFLRSLFNYGDVFVQTAGEKLHFDFLAVPQPTRVVDIIQNLIGRRHHA